MDSYSIIVVAEETAPVRRFEIRKDLVRRLAWCAGVGALLLTVCLGDYIRVRIAYSELGRLRVEVVRQRGEIESFDATLNGVRSTLANIGEFERKVRIIANLPGSAATGGEEVSEVGVDSPEPEPQLGGSGVAAPVEAPLPDAASERQSRIEIGSDEPLIVAWRRGAELLGELAIFE